MREDDDRSRMRARARRMLAGLLVLSACALAAAPAGAVIVHLRSGKAVSYQPLRGAFSAGPFDAAFSNLDYNGGPVMPSNTNYAIFWSPTGPSAYPAEYEAGVAQYFEDLAHDSGGHENADSVSAQYNDFEGDYARYDSHFGGILDDAHKYPSNGCFKAPKCITDRQIEQELERFIGERKLPADLTHEYFILTPENVEDCFEEEGAQCSVGTTAKERYCAYHSAFETVSEQIVVYANDPYVNAPKPGCEDGIHPNGKPSDGVIQGGLSHEHNESITDPLLTAWEDRGGSGGENGDKCRNKPELEEFGTPLGTTKSGAKYNQLINGHPYWYQQEWSNQGKKCLQRWTRSGEAPTATFTSEKGAGNELKFDATGSTAAEGVAHYNWKFNDGPKEIPTETTTPKTSHTFKFVSPFTVALTVFAKDGSSIGTARLVLPGHSGPTPAFTTLTTTPATGAPVTFDASASKAFGGSITKYAWNFGDGSAVGSGVSPSHTYAAVGVYLVTMRVTDSVGQVAPVTHAVEVDEPPTASIAPPQPTAGAPAIFDGSSSFDGTSVSETDGKIVSYSWNFGDGSEASGAKPEHTYAVPGPYTVTLTVTDSSGLTAKASVELAVIAKPTAVTEPASSIGQTTATLNASVTPNGVLTECEFEYGETKAAGGSTAPCVPPLGAGFGAAPVSAILGAVQPERTYHYRVVAKNSAGTTLGAEREFTTLPKLAPSVAGEAASAIAKTTATLGATVDPNGAVVEECRFEYGTSVFYETSVPCAALPGAGTSPVAVAAAVGSLAAGTTYHFRVVARSAAGKTEGADTTFATVASPLPAPPPNDTFTASATLNRRTGTITFSASVSDPGTFALLATFPNGRFGVFSASVRCRRGFVRLAGKCRPSKVVFAKGAATVAAASTVPLTLKPSSAARKALRAALKRGQGVPVRVTLTFQSARGGMPTTHTFSIVVRLKKH